MPPILPASILLPAPVTAHARQHSPLLHTLMAVGAGCLTRSSQAPSPIPSSLPSNLATLAFCHHGSGWFELEGRRRPVRTGDLLALPQGTPHSLGPNPADPWTLHWILATGSELDPWFALLDATPLSPVLHLAEAMQVTLLIDEIHRSLADNPGILSLLRASRALAHLLAVALHHHHPPEGDSAVSRRIGHCIEYLTTHLDQPLRIAALAHLAHLSPARFSVLFRSFTGSPPRDYLHLVRMHRACQWLTDTTLPLKTIAAQLGYQDQFHFSRKFKAFAGLPPGAYRTTHRQTQVRTS